MKNDRLKLKNIFQSLPASYLVLRPDLTIVAVTDNFYKLFEASPKDFIGKNIFDAFPESKETAEAHSVGNTIKSFKHVIRYRTPHTIPVQRYDIKLPPRDNGKFVTRWWRITNSPVLDDNGELLYIINAVEDITKMVDVLDEAHLAIKRSAANRVK